MFRVTKNQCLGSGSKTGFVGSVRFWLPGSGRIQGAKYQPKTAKKCLLSIPKSKLLKNKRENKNVLISECIQISEKNKTKNLKILLC